MLKLDYLLKEKVNNQALHMKPRTVYTVLDETDNEKTHTTFIK